MTKHRSTFEHTADVGIEAWGDSLAQLIEALGEALADYICPIESVRPVEVRPIEVLSDDAEALAVDLLGMLLNLVQVDKFLVARINIRQASATAASGEIEGEQYNADRHELAHEVKAITYHKLLVAQEAGRWHGRVILDI